ncbi:MAG: hypothetical protein HKO09_00185 [Croceitalea sp.]|nr:hypothetical protein [Croceitalea sp.]
MIKFFRKIRQNLIVENKTGKYIKYAIGEIVLVVIGILIALQINNWNQNRLEQKREHQILKDLYVEFDANFNDLTRVKEQHEIVFNQFSGIQRITATKDYHSESLDSLMLSVTSWFSFTERPGASDNLINSGNLNILTNEELRNLITQWSGIVDDVKDDELFGAEFTRDTFLPFIAQTYPASNIEYRHEQFYRTYTQNKSLEITPIIGQKTVDWATFLNIPEFQSLLSLRKIYEMHSIAEVEVALEACKKIRNLIDSELKQ